MPLHNDKPNTDRLDKLARIVLAAAIEFEREEAENTAKRNTYGADSSAKEKLLEAVRVHREALVAELIGSEQAQGSTV